MHLRVYIISSVRSRSFVFANLDRVPVLRGELFQFEKIQRGRALVREVARVEARSSTGSSDPSQALRRNSENRALIGE